MLEMLISANLSKKNTPVVIVHVGLNVVRLARVHRLTQRYVPSHAQTMYAETLLTAVTRLKTRYGAWHGESQALQLQLRSSRSIRPGLDRCEHGRIAGQMAGDRSGRDR